MQGTQVQSLCRKIPWRSKWQPTPVFLLEKYQGQRSLVGYSPQGCKESDTTEQLNKKLRRLLQGFKQHEKINVELAPFSLSDPSLLLMGGPPTPPHPCHTSVPSQPQMLTAAWRADPNTHYTHHLCLILSLLNYFITPVLNSWLGTHTCIPIPFWFQPSSQCPLAPRSW